MVKDLLQTITSSQNKIYEYFGFDEKWCVNPIDDHTDQFWFVENDMICFADSKQELENKEKNYYEEEIDETYSKEDFTAFVVDIHVDGNPPFFMVFDNSKRI
jgi:hypothetical protein